MQVDKTLLYQELRARLKTCGEEERAGILRQISEICAVLEVKS